MKKSRKASTRLRVAKVTWAGKSFLFRQQHPGSDAALYKRRNLDAVDTWPPLTEVTTRGSVEAHRGGRPISTCASRERARSRSRARSRRNKRNSCSPAFGRNNPRIMLDIHVLSASSSTLLACCHLRSGSSSAKKEWFYVVPKVQTSGDHDGEWRFAVADVQAPPFAPNSTGLNTGGKSRHSILPRPDLQSSTKPLLWALVCASHVFVWAVSWPVEDRQGTRRSSRARQLRNPPALCVHCVVVYAATALRQSTATCFALIGQPIWCTHALPILDRIFPPWCLSGVLCHNTA